MGVRILKKKNNRAFNPEEKSKRRDLILASAEEMLGQNSSENVTVGSLAKKTGLAKGTIYLYFPNKSVILLSILGRRFDFLLSHICEALSQIPEPANAESVAKTIVTSLQRGNEAQRVIRLLDDLSDQHSGAALEGFFGGLESWAPKLDATMRAKLPLLRPTEGMRILRYSWAFLLGLTDMSNRRQHSPPPATTRLPRMNVETNMTEAVTMMIKGFLSRP